MTSTSPSSQAKADISLRMSSLPSPLHTTDKQYFRGADVSGSNQPSERRAILRSFAANNLEVTNAFYTHPKILVTALNGPVIGLSAALIAFSDFIYATPSTFLLTPFTSLGLVSEGATSFSLVQRLGISKANEALIMSKRLTSSELLAAGFVNKIFDDVRDGEDEKFLGLVWKEVEDRLGEHLNQDSLIKVKELIRKPYREVLDRQNAEEVLAGVERFVKGEPQKEFSRIAKGEKRHKL